MYFVIAGAGEVGFQVARTLRAEGHEVALIERSPPRAKRASDLDILVIEGNGASEKRLREAHIEDAHQFIGVTGVDEVNMVGAAVAHSYGVKRTMARVNDPEYIDEPWTARFRGIGVDIAVCPELVAAEKISDTLRAPSLLNVDVFADKVAIAEIKIAPDAPCVARAIKDIHLPEGINFVAVNRAGDTHIAHGELVLHPEDKVLVAFIGKDAPTELEPIVGRPRYMPAVGDIKKVMIAGATRIGIHLARRLEAAGKEVILIDPDERRCHLATEQLDHTLIIQGDAKDRALLIEEDIGTVDAFVGGTDVEEHNVLSCLLAKRLGVKKTVALISQPELRDVVEGIQIDLAISPRLSTVGTVLRHVYRSDTQELVMTQSGDAQILEFRVHDDSKIAGRSMKRAGLPRETLVAAIIRGDLVLLPRGNDVLLPGDHVVVFSKPEEIPRLERLFA